MTKVKNLSTGEEMIYSLCAREAVIAAFEYSHGNRNTYNYKNSKAKLHLGQFTVAAGDWCAMRDDIEQPGPDCILSL
jgi:hypothetical protein